jgi:hypothetical protein
VRTTSPADRDRGDTLLEILIAIVLLGTIVASTLTGLGVTVNGTAMERDRATAQMWLQSSIEALKQAPTQDCNDVGQTESSLRTAYEDAVRAAVPPPPGWDAAQLRIVPPVRFWDPRLQFQDACYDDYGFELQLIELEVSSPDGEVIERVHAVVGGG